MSDPNAVESFTPIAKGQGSTPAEMYLQGLCEKNFLSLWSYARPFRDQGSGKEICDLLVVLGDDVIIFSDKHCLLTPKHSLEVDWQRWFRSAVKAGALQAWGAERWLREHPARIFLDQTCEHHLPVPLPASNKARYHLVVTVHGVSGACKAMLGGSGSLELRTDVQGLEKHQEPFVIGDLDPKKSFVHVFDDATLAIIMAKLDTATDFLKYLRAKEEFLRSRFVYVAGEENHLGFFLARVDETGEHAFVVDDSTEPIGIDDSWWPNFLVSPEYEAQLEHDRISYFWDGLIEAFAKHALAGTQHFATEPAFESSEKVLRVMAAEPRLMRRYLSRQVFEALETTQPDQRRLRVAFTQESDETMYVFLLFPWRHDRPHEQNRTVRRNYLEACIHVAKLKNPSAKDIVGIATESGTKNSGRSEDAMYFDARSWTEEDESRAKELQKDLDILTSPKLMHSHIEEYPLASDSAEPALGVSPNPRNKPCPCGSGKKYKLCHGRPVSHSGRS